MSDDFSPLRELLPAGLGTGATEPGGLPPAAVACGTAPAAAPPGATARGEPTEDRPLPSQRRGGPVGRTQVTGPIATGAALTDPAYVIAMAWPGIVGDEAAANSHPVRLRQARLIVAASSSAWAQTLQLMEETIKPRLSAVPGVPAIDRIQFRHAGWEERPRQCASAGPGRGGSSKRASASTRPPAGARGRAAAGPSPTTESGPAPAAPVLTSEQEEALSEVRRLQLDPKLEESILGAMEAAFVRGERDSVR